jgi:PPOX class probable F420-dependent enzyme
MGIALNDEVRRLLDGRHFAVLATINPDGGPQTSAMWVARDGDDVLFSTVAGRRKHRNLERDPRASVTAPLADASSAVADLPLRSRRTAFLRATPAHP